MNRIKIHPYWAVLNVLGLSVLAYTVSQGRADWNSGKTFDAGLESGKWAVRFLLGSLSMTPLRTYFGWNQAIRLRKTAGLWSFGFAALHVSYFFYEYQFQWFVFPFPPFLAYGIGGFLILCALALTSNRFSMQRLRANWKRLHRLVYAAGGAVMIHAILATTSSKRMSFDPDAIHELRIYLGVLVVLLAVRIPQVRQLIMGLRPKLAARPSKDIPIKLVATAQAPPEFGQAKANGHDRSLLLNIAQIQEEDELDREVLEVFHE